MYLYIRVNPLKSLVTVAAHLAAYSHLVVSSDLIRVLLHSAFSDFSLSGRDYITTGLIINYV